MHTGLILAVDAGNTRIKCALLKDCKPRVLGDIHHLVTANPADGIAWQTLEEKAPDGILASCVSGSNASLIRRLCDQWPTDLFPEPQLVTNAKKLPIKIDVDFPEQVGLDRVLNSVASNCLRNSERPAIVIDSGTATTVDLVTADGAFAGGAILPGMELSARALHQYTDLLPLVDVQELDVESVLPPGKNTVDAIQNGILLGHVGAIRELVSRMADRIDGSPELFITGGAGRLLAPLVPEATLVPYMSLRALGSIT